MAKKKLKEALGVESGHSLIDVHRPVPKCDGGEYIDGNIVIKTPVEHMKEHGIYRERDLSLDAIKAIVDDRRQVMKLVMKVQNQLLAYERRVDFINDMTEQWLKDQLDIFKSELKIREKMLTRAVKEYGKIDKLTVAALGVKGIGPITVAHCLTYIDIEKARHASSLWAYVGLDKPSHERYTKGSSGGGNKTLRTALYTMADAQIKTRGAYRGVYDDTKSRLEKSERIVKTRNTQGQLVEKPWKDVKPSHRHGAAIRKMIKHFLADWWYASREIAGLPTDALYPEAILGGNHRTIMPKERGWEY